MLLLKDFNDPLFSTKGATMWFHILLYAMMATQMAAWAWLQYKGGKLPDRSYIIFCGMLMIGQTGATIECILGQAWGTLAVQVYFFIFTAYGGWRRYQQMESIIKETTQ